MEASPGAGRCSRDAGPMQAAMRRLHPFQDMQAGPSADNRRATCITCKHQLMALQEPTNLRYVNISKKKTCVRPVIVRQVFAE